MLLRTSGLPVTPAAVRHESAAQIRQDASAAALAQELCIYKKSHGKLVGEHFL
jgi:hypothetical protein